MKLWTPYKRLGKFWNLHSARHAKSMHVIKSKHYYDIFTQNIQLRSYVHFLLRGYNWFTISLDEFGYALTLKQTKVCQVKKIGGSNWLSICKALEWFSCDWEHCIRTFTCWSCLWKIPMGVPKKRIFMIQILGNPEFGPWPQVKGLTLRVPLNPCWQLTKTLWFFFLKHKSH